MSWQLPELAADTESPWTTAWFCPRRTYESRLADSVDDLGEVDRALRRYLSADRSDAWSVGQWHEAYRDLSSALAHVVGALLDGADGWSPSWWVDSVMIEGVESASELKYDLRGGMIWGDERHHWVEPLQAVLSLSDAGVSAYEINIADASIGLRRVPYTRRQTASPTRGGDWLFMFRRSRSSGHVA